MQFKIFLFLAVRAARGIEKVSTTRQCFCASPRST